MLVLRSIGQAERENGGIFDSEQPLNAATIELRFRDYSKTISRGRKTPMYMFLGGLETFYGVFWPFFTISTTKTEPNLTYIKLML